MQAERGVFLRTFVQELLPSTAAGQRNFDTKLTNKAIALDNPVRSSTAESIKDQQLKRAYSSHRTKTMPAREKKLRRLFALPDSAAQYRLYEPLHNLWLQYIGDVLGPSAAATVTKALDSGSVGAASSVPVSLLAASTAAGATTQLTDRLLKADLHGAPLTVLRSVCPAYVGLSGLVVQERQNSFKLVTRADRFVLIPKQHTVFRVDLPGFAVELYGSHFAFRPADRSKGGRWKTKDTVEL